MELPAFSGVVLSSKQLPPEWISRHRYGVAASDSNDESCASIC